MEEQERREESAENDSPNNVLEDCEDVFGGNSAGKLVRQRRSSIMKRKSVRTVSKSVSFSSIPSEKKVANGKVT